MSMLANIITVGRHFYSIQLYFTTRRILEVGDNLKMTDFKEYLDFYTPLLLQT